MTMTMKEAIARKSAGETLGDEAVTAFVVEQLQAMIDSSVGTFEQRVALRYAISATKNAPHVRAALLKAVAGLDEVSAFAVLAELQLKREEAEGDDDDE